MSPETVENIGQLRILLLIITVIAFFVYWIPKTIKKAHGYLLITLYGLFVVYIVLKGFDTSLPIITNTSDALSAMADFFSRLF